MPIEILELVVRANVQEANDPLAMDLSSQQTNESENLPRQQLVEECVMQVLEILKRREER